MGVSKLQAIKKSPSWKKAHIIIYDPVNKNLREADIEAAEQIGLVEAKVPGRGRRADIYLYVGAQNYETKTFLATVDLGRLSKNVRWQRFCGNIGNIWIAGKEGAEPIKGCLRPSATKSCWACP